MDRFFTVCSHAWGLGFRRSLVSSSVQAIPANTSRTWEGTRAAHDSAASGPRHVLTSQLHLHHLEHGTHLPNALLTPLSCADGCAGEAVSHVELGRKLRLPGVHGDTLPHAQGRPCSGWL